MAQDDYRDPPLSANPGPLILPRPKRDLFLRAVATGILLLLGYIAVQVTEIKQDMDKALTTPAVQGQNIQPGITTK